MELPSKNFDSSYPIGFLFIFLFCKYNCASNYFYIHLIVGVFAGYLEYSSSREILFPSRE